MLISRSTGRSALVLVLLLLTVAPPARPMLAEHSPKPTTVTIPGTLQSVLGCPGDWQPTCAKTDLAFDAEDDLWQATFELPAGEYEYKAALNQSWEENYGAKAAAGGPNIPLKLASPAPVKFVYDHKTHWVADGQNALIANVPGSFQSELGCAQDWAPDCLRSLLQDPEGDGTYTFITKAIPAGSYEAKVAINESWTENYGENGAKDGANIAFEVPKADTEVYFGYDAAKHTLTISVEGAPKGSLSSAQAHWVARDTILWDVIGSPKYTYTLHYEPAGALQLEPSGITGGKALTLTFAQGGPGAEVFKRFPHLAGASTLTINQTDLARLPEILKGQMVVAAFDAEQKMVDSTALQLPGVLDDLYAFDGDLGLSYEGAVPTLRVWAPTARSVTLHRFADSTSSLTTTVAMAGDPATGVWSTTGSADWTNQFYLYEVEVFVRSTGKIERNLVTDPYALSLSTNSRRSQIVNLAEPALKPTGWDTVARPSLAAPEDIVLYELHIRDFSINDQTVPAEQRGTFKAFTNAGSDGMQHLTALAEAGLTHVHLLPAFDVASIEEDKTRRKELDSQQLASFGSAAKDQQALISAARDQDGFNWGYDPYHYTVPEGSYATNPDGATRIVEFREMVQALSSSGLGVVMDVVYNHTNASGQSEKSVLDKIVPGYYHRLNEKGNVETSTCCQNTATEHAMMEKLMVDSLVTWARHYKVDGFRFDLMGHHMVANMQKVRDALDALTIADDGVDGTRIYIYGEGWNFGEVKDNARGINATQLNLTGSGIGAFSDRLRDAVRGGGPFSGFQEQGFITGLADQPNGTEQGTPEEQQEKILLYADQIRVGLAGNLQDFPLVDRRGEQVTGAEVSYNGQPAGYTSDPQEQILYIEAHDNETLFDAIQVKAAPAATLQDRVRMQNLGMSLVGFGQGVPFFHAGQELLRSKSLDRNSYNSGDWFNRLDWTYQTNNWGVGLPPAESNEDKWPLLEPILSNPALKPGKPEIMQALNHFTETLRIRQSSPLFRLQTAEQIKQRLTFQNTGPQQIPGLVVMTLDDIAGENLDARHDRIVVVFNATTQEQAVSDEIFKSGAFTLHPLQAASQDATVQQASFSAGVFTVPGRTTAVFVQPQGTGSPSATMLPTAVAPTGAAPATPAPTSAAPAATAQPTVAPTPPAATPAPAASGSGPSLPIWLGVDTVGIIAAAMAFRRRNRAR